MVDEVERYRYVTSQIQYLSERTIDSLKLYLQLLSGLAGGYVWMRSSMEMRTLFWLRTAGPALVLLLGAATLLLIYGNLQSKKQFQLEEARLRGPDAGSTIPVDSTRQERTLMILVALVRVGGAIYFMM